MGSGGAYTHRDVPRRATFVIDPDRTIQFDWSARSPDEQPDLDASGKATNCRDDQCAIDESEESVCGRAPANG